jgi:hypothetical protein
MLKRQLKAANPTITKKERANTKRNGITTTIKVTTESTNSLRKLELKVKSKKKK